MAAEGLDIATIDTIVLATPKTDIEQAVGRIRPKTGVSERNTPLVIDIVDEFSIFENQAFKRLAFYKKKNYEITTTKVAKDGKVLSSYTYSAYAEGAEEAQAPPKSQKKGFGFSKLKQEESK
jgi:superfamily II DNA/RNA helicase